MGIMNKSKTNQSETESELNGATTLSYHMAIVGS
jgi:hypothetical protein